MHMYKHIYIYIYLYQLRVDTGCSLEDLLGAIDDWDRWRERDGESE